jgi:hypothetical protein
MAFTAFPLEAYFETCLFESAKKKGSKRGPVRTGLTEQNYGVYVIVPLKKVW